LASLILVVNVVGELQRKRTLAASRGFLAAARLSCTKGNERFCATLYVVWDIAIISVISLLRLISCRFQLVFFGHDILHKNTSN